MRASDCRTVDTLEFLLAALEQASEAIVIVDSDLRIRHFNAAAESIWGVRRAEVLDCDAHGLGFNELQNGAESEITIRRNDGSRIRAQLSVSRVEIAGRANYMRFCALSANINVNMKSPTVYLTTRSRSNVVAISRGVSCALAT